MFREKYTEDEIKLVRAYFDECNKMGSAKKISNLLQGSRSVKSILRQATLIGINKPRPKWTPEEDDRILTHFDNRDALNSCSKIAWILTGRTAFAVKQRAYRLGLCRPLKTRTWDKQELDLLHNSAENVPLSVMYKKFQKLWNKLGLQHRSQKSISCKLTALGYSTKFEGDYYTLDQLSTAFGCSRKHVGVLYETYNNILLPEKMGKYNVVSLLNLRRFIIKYPGELAKLKPDIIWLISVMSPDSQISQMSRIRKTKEEWDMSV
jgi:hypothetical protein